MSASVSACALVHGEEKIDYSDLANWPDNFETFSQVKYSNDLSQILDMASRNIERISKIQNINHHSQIFCKTRIKTKPILANENLKNVRLQPFF